MGVKPHFDHIDFAELPPYWKAPVRKPRRARWNDYTSRSIYMITLNKSPQTPPLSEIAGIVPEVRVRLHPAGEIAARCLEDLHRDFPHIRILTHVVMPDHIHFLIFVTEPGGPHLGVIINRYKKLCSTALNAALGHGTPESRISFWEEGYFDTILKGKGQLPVLARYIATNPLRLALRRQNPDLFRRGLLITKSGNGNLPEKETLTENGNLLGKGNQLEKGNHPVKENQYEAYGNLFLLKSPQRVAVRYSRSYAPGEWEKMKRGYAAAVRNGAVLVSPFIHPEEREVRREALEAGGSVITIAPVGYCRREKPPGRAFDLCAEGRMLILTRPGTYAATGVLSREECLAMNAIATEIAALDPGALHFKPM